MRITQKGEDVRCRFVGQEFAAGDSRTDLFASTTVSLGEDHRVEAGETLVVDVAGRSLRLSLRQGLSPRKIPLAREVHGAFIGLGCDT